MSEDHSLHEGQIEKREEAEQKPRDAKYWHLELQAAHTREKQWREKRGPAVVKRYRDERTTASTSEQFNILWSNTETLKSALYAESASPDVRRRFGQKDKVGRTAATVLERALSYCADEYDLDCPIEQAIEDYLLPGRGLIWVDYEPELDEQGEIAGQTTKASYVYWQFFRQGDARSEAEVPWKGRAHLLTREQLEESFPEHAAKVPMDQKIDGSGKTTNDEDKDVFKRALVWEIWDRTKMERVYVCEGYPIVLKVDEDPYGLKDFFPCPPSLYAVRTNKNMVPIPEFTEYQDQAKELDKVTTRINKLMEELKHRGVYDAQFEDTLGELPVAGDGEFIPIEQFAQMQEKGGLERVIAAMPIDKIIVVLQGLYQHRDQLVQTIYEITGISDIIRGATDPRETKGAQQLKAQFGSMRMQKRQKAVQRFVRDTFRIKAELIAEHYTPEVLAQITGVELPRRAEIQQQIQGIMAQAMQAVQSLMVGPVQPDPQQVQQAQQEVQQQIEQLQDEVTWEDVMEVLRSDERRGYKIDVETDSTVFQDAEQEKQSRMEFMEVLSSMFERTIPAMVNFPGSVPLVKEGIMFTVRGFKVGRTLEEAIEDAFEELANQPPNQGDPEADAKQQEMQMKMQEMQAQMQMKQAEFELKQQEMEAKIQALITKSEIDMQKAQTDMAIKREEAQSDAIIAQQKAAVDRDIAQDKAQADMAIASSRAQQQARQANGADTN